ncbi:hypothetical protein [Bacillus safensis]|uniref:hypothetical protein n=1 Tax=Bacillus safensis TaxID=561879 RepID=UPI0039829DAD
MIKRKVLLDVDVMGLLNGLTITSSTAPKVKIKQFEVWDDSMLISDALQTITRQMKVSGNRSRTISDYVLHVEHFQSITNVNHVDDITADTVYKWLDSMNVSNQTKLTRLKCLKAFLSRCLIMVGLK